MCDNSVMRWVVLAGVVSLAVGAAVSGGLMWVVTRSAPPHVVRAAISASGSAALNIASPDRDLAMTPDGKQLVYIGNNGTQLFVRSLDQLEATALVTLPAQERAGGRLRGVFTSPDGGWAVWVANSQSCRKDARTNSLAVIRAVTADPESFLRIPRWFTQGRSTLAGIRSIDTRRNLRSCPAAASRTHLMPPSASGRALDSAAASDMTGHSPVRRPQPRPAYAPSAPRGRDDR